ncbi:2Fe-2S iron-sulfur cluster binding domain-containing protein [Paracoccidioides lutzii Pb01]|uniref:2Fe-2S iron-sulfur cluster binding domain-containing protein n=1 Tax=Paracoccidioides lutzii (strain ATCC MYA-826 / Pb01) TaxID=502779 RepID=C1H0G5_PARBA|nr:2Fe-2S iron-sulfur cluster binding domain-containing protein [Paracoccidioides lutzii Pb01]EEH33206.1 2Fe-2S iron-sulfur cluster binding domain-containing protein [Paracoccidioides lutzii Pb01]
MSICNGIACQLRISASHFLSNCRPLAHQTKCRNISITSGSRMPNSGIREYSACVRPTSLTRSGVNVQCPQYITRARRRFSATVVASHGHIEPPKPGEQLNVTFIDKDGEKHHFQVAKGDNLLDIAQANDLEMEGACGGSCACSTCHVIVEDADMYDKMEEPDDDENDMLDLAFGLTETSRLGCQVKMSPELDGLVVRLPSMTRNLQASDFEQK